MYWMVHLQISQSIHTFFIHDILGKFVMNALFSDSSSWQTTFPGICNVTVLESDKCSYTKYEASVQNWPGMYCNDMIAHMYKTPLTEQPNCIFSLAFFCFITSLLQKINTNVLLYLKLPKVCGQEVTSRFPMHVMYHTALHALCRIQRQCKRESCKFKTLLKCDHNRWRRLMCTKLIT
jgi:hypothetical protein